MQTPTPELSLKTLADDYKALKKQLAKNNAMLRKAVKIGITMLDGTRGASSEDLKTALQAVADTICTRPPGCYPEPTDGGDS